MTIHLQLRPSPVTSSLLLDTDVLEITLDIDACLECPFAWWRGESDCIDLLSHSSNLKTCAISMNIGKLILQGEGLKIASSGFCYCPHPHSPTLSLMSWFGGRGECDDRSERSFFFNKWGHPKKYMFGNYVIYVKCRIQFVFSYFSFGIMVVGMLPLPPMPTGGGV